MAWIDPMAPRFQRTQSTTLHGLSGPVLLAMTTLLSACGAGESAPDPTANPGSGGAGNGPPSTPVPSAAGNASMVAGGSGGVPVAVGGETNQTPEPGSMPAGMGGDAAGMPPPSADTSATALEQLRTYLAMPRDARPDLLAQPFASVALTKDDAATAQDLLWDDFATEVRETRQDEVGASETEVRSIELDGFELRYVQTTLGDEPPDGRSLFISMHGGGLAASSVNDSQWRNQLALASGYNPEDALWVAPRAPTDDWNMWFKDHIDPLFDRLITDLIVFEGIHPNKVYLTGYSAGGDGVYRVGPRMADRWAGAGMSAGHPGEASALNLRNIAFALHAGGNDTAYDRNLTTAEWGEWLDELEAEDPTGYPHQWQVHAGLPHWMNLADAVSIPFLQAHTRNPLPARVVWQQAEVTQSRFYWLAVDPGNEAAGTEVRASYAANTVTIDVAAGLSSLDIRLSDAMLDMDQPVRIEFANAPLFEGVVERTIGVSYQTLVERGDPELTFSGEVTVELP